MSNEKDKKVTDVDNKDGLAEEKLEEEIQKEKEELKRKQEELEKKEEELRKSKSQGSDSLKELKSNILKKSLLSFIAILTILSLINVRGPYKDMDRSLHLFQNQQKPLYNIRADQERQGPDYEADKAEVSSIDSQIINLNEKISIAASNKDLDELNEIKEDILTIKSHINAYDGVFKGELTKNLANVTHNVDMATTVADTKERFIVALVSNIIMIIFFQFLAYKFIAKNEELKVLTACPVEEKNADLEKLSILIVILSIGFIGTSMYGSNIEKKNEQLLSSYLSEQKNFIESAEKLTEADDFFIAQTEMLYNDMRRTNINFKTDHTKDFDSRIETIRDELKSEELRGSKINEDIKREIERADNVYEDIKSDMDKLDKLNMYIIPAFLLSLLAATILAFR